MQYQPNSTWHVPEQPSPPAMLPSSHPSPRLQYALPSPQCTSQRERVAPVELRQRHPASTAHPAQPSPTIALPSSQLSAPHVLPSPHTSRQELGTSTSVARTATFRRERVRLNEAQPVPFIREVTSVNNKTEA